MEKNIFPVILSLLLSSCGSSYYDYPCMPAYGCVPHGTFVREDPDPLCKFKREPTSQELFEKLISGDLFELDLERVKVPYRYEHSQQAQQPQQVQVIKCKILK